MSTAQSDRPTHAPTSRGRLRRSGRAMTRVGLALLLISLVVALVAGLATRSVLNNLRDNSAELLDGTATVALSQGDQRALYVTGGLVAPGEIVPTPVEAIRARWPGRRATSPWRTSRTRTSGSAWTTRSPVSRWSGRSGPEPRASTRSTAQAWASSSPRKSAPRTVCCASAA
ncbi:hypothetical protein [Ornithinimicrobium sp. W1665]|uniref:hypothetical protein n=1 Tax=Ornithinimicrobium sp. W1665 TaxID=3416666 RepID=UPI003D6C325F